MIPFRWAFCGMSASFRGSVNSHALMSPQSFLVCTAQLRLQLNNSVNVQDMDLAAWCMQSSHMDGLWMLLILNIQAHAATIDVWVRIHQARILQDSEYGHHEIIKVEILDTLQQDTAVPWRIPNHWMVSRYSEHVLQRLHHLFQTLPPTFTYSLLGGTWWHLWQYHWVASFFGFSSEHPHIQQVSAVEPF